MASGMIKKEQMETLHVTNGIDIYKLGKMCILKMQLTREIAVRDNYVATISDNNFIPSLSWRGNCVVLSSAVNHAFLALLDDGRIDIYNADGATGTAVQTVGEMTYFVD